MENKRNLWPLVGAIVIGWAIAGLLGWVGEVISKVIGGGM